MVDISKLDMTDIWASGGDKVAPLSTKIAQGWVVEAVPRQTWNWFENRQDQNIAYLLQKGFPEWDTITEYQANKSWVNRGGTVYRSIQTGVNQDPSTATTYWVRAFPEYSVSLDALRALTPAANQLPYFTGTNTAAVTTLSAFGRTLIDDADAATARATLSAQLAATNLTSLSGVSAAVNVLPYFDSSTSMTGTTLTAFARSLLDDVDVVAARSTLGVTSSVDTAQALTDGLATKQPLSATLTAHAGVTTAANTLSYWTGVNAAAVTTLTAFARTLLDDTDAATARATLSVDSSAESATNLSTGLATKQPLNALLTSVAALTTTANSMIYYTGASTAAVATLTAYARGLMATVDAGAARTYLGTDNATNLTSGTVALARLPTDLTGINAATATKLQTARTIQGVSFDGTGNIILSVVDKDSSTGSAAIPAGTTAQRSANGVGKFRFNTETSRAEINNGTTWGSLGGASGGGNDAVFYCNDQNVTASYTIPAGQNAMSAGPITIANGATVTVSDGSVWTIV